MTTHTDPDVYAAQIRARLRGFMELELDRGDGLPPRSIGRVELARGLGVSVLTVHRMLNIPGRRETSTRVVMARIGGITLEDEGRICRVLNILPEQLHSPVMTPGRLKVLANIQRGATDPEKHNKRRVADLLLEGFVERDSDGVLRITEAGRAFLPTEL